MSVSLVEGSVSLDTGRGSRRLLRPGEIACYDPDTRKMVIGRGNVAMESCWAAGKLAFERRSLGEICRYMARWYDTEIHITPASHTTTPTFTITNEPLEEILRIMSRINPIATRSPKTTPSRFPNSNKPCITTFKKPDCL